MKTFVRLGQLNPMRVQCRWCRAAVGTRCTVRGMTRPLRDAMGQYTYHPTRIEDLQELLDREAATAPAGEEVVVDPVDL